MDVITNKQAGKEKTARKTNPLHTILRLKV